MNKIYLTQVGYDEYLQQIEEIRAKIQKNSSDITEYQSSDAYGDGWHDNFAYEQAMKKENALFFELETKLKALKNIVIIDEKDTDKTIIGINSIVSIKFEGEAEIETYTITGGITSKIDDEEKSITINSPLGSALLGKKENDNFAYEVDNIRMSGKIISIK